MIVDLFTTIASRINLESRDRKASLRLEPLAARPVEQVNQQLAAHCLGQESRHRLVALVVVVEPGLAVVHGQGRSHIGQARAPTGIQLADR